MPKQLTTESGESQVASSPDTSVPVGPIVFLEEEADIFKRLVSSPDTPDKVVPSDIETNELWRYLTLTAKVINKTAQSQARMKLLFGRQLLLVKEHEDLYRRYGYGSWNDFMTNGVPNLLNISRGEAYNCAKVAEALAFLSTEKVEALGFSKANSLATAIRRDTDPGMPVEMVEQKRAEWVRRAEKSTVKELREHMESNNLADKGEFEIVSLVLPVNPETKKRWTAFYENPDIRAFIESDKPGDLLDRMIEECSSEWSAQITDSERN